MATPRPPAEAWQEMLEQRESLQVACREFDAGKRFFAKDIAQRAYTLLHSRGAQVISVLDQCGFAKLPELFLTTSSFVEGGMMPLSGVPLCMNRYVIYDNGKSEAFFAPRSELIPTSPADRRVDRNAWWNEIVFWAGYDGQGNRAGTLTRGVLIQSLTDKDGARHFEQSNDPAYAAMKYDAFPGVWRLINNEPPAPLVDAHYATMRQIGYELDDTLAAIIAAGPPF